MHLPHSRLVLALLLSSLFLASCGGGGGGGSSTASNETINGIVVPPEPDANTNNATIAGVDSNSNGVRDDVERTIAKDFGGNKTDYDLVRIHAVGVQALISQPSLTTVKSYIDFVECLDSEALKKLSKITRMTVNSNERGRAYATSLTTIKYTPEECK